MNPLAQAPILVVEDSLEDFAALSRALRTHAVPNPVVHCPSGEQALEYLQSRSQHPGWRAARPAFILLSLHMASLDGRDVLRALKHDVVLSPIPVIIFTSSARPRDVEECYRLGANSYLTKPMTYSSLEEKVGLLVRYWLHASELPYLA